ncbi:cellulose biosynthesis cyclic di-GMP-binding regulatory protein BcsB [Spongiibacter sp. KMU-166]|uniref:Cyclic di-GMP-binding protein n=1 Tax=Spongiibacter thalassae TaxID=2721624 RepID=A0ABX1GF58_9GAMM|nr:cellulose biosynthesis cyclic di-GMP-binding regulatory protein BcsB [Spongiibacter thalassae]NKI17840.1 cellulose biosynthesis cyclic di-GMP-binding regulatory protein BcsB [Spongiibacter thalassae]
MLAIVQPLWATAAVEADSTAELMLESEAWLLESEPAPEFRDYQLKLQELGYPNSAKLRGSESSVYMNFGSRLDEIIVGGELRFHYTVSPALMAKFSHLKVYLNEEIMGVIPITDEARIRQYASVQLDPKYFADYNQLRVELIGHLDKECWSPDDYSIWTEVSGSTEIRLRAEPLRVANDLSLIPAPFFDKRDFRRLTLPVVLPSNYSLEKVRAAGVTTSWFGSLARWRGASFPLSINELPDDHAIVFMTNDARPKIFEDFPPVDAPTLQMIDHPTKVAAKLLLIQGRNDEELNQAVRGLVLGTALLSGPVAVVNRAEQVKPREPYDAPHWLPTDRAVHIGELVDDPAQLQVVGRTPPPIKVSFQLPPDLFTWRSRGIPLKLDYRYSPLTYEGTGSMMSMSINDQFVEGFNLTDNGFSGTDNRVRVPLINDSFISVSERLKVPAFKVGSQNQMVFQFDFAGVASGACKTVSPGRRYAAIDADSTLDFTGLPHYIEMPNLRAFVNAGFPFTRMADLSETAVLIPQNAPKEVLETFFQLMGAAGASSGFPAISVSLFDKWDKEQLKLRESDILSIAINPKMSGLKEKQIPLIFDDARRAIELPIRNIEPGNEVWGGAVPELAESAENVEITSSGGFAAVVGLQSPYNSSRSVVSVMATKPADFKMVQEALNDSGRINYMFGSVVTFRGDQQTSYNVGDKYFVGALPLWDLIWFHFSRYPLLLGFLSVLVVLLLAVFLRRVLGAMAAKRLRGGK